jgi:P27 family predicted phage terminase small subunit
VGLRGPLPKSDREKRLAGTWRKDRSSKLPLPSRTPAEIPTSPMELSPEEQLVWNRYAPNLVARGFLDEANAALLSILCTLEARFDSLNALLHREGFLYTTSRGKTRERPEAQIQRRMVSSLMSLWRMFGLTPRSRRQLGLG